MNMMTQTQEPKAKGMRTRDRILDIAASSVLEKGFGATSIDELVAEAEITKSGFFYHFKDKNALALALLQRYVEQDHQFHEDIMVRAAELTDDPLQTILVALKLFAEYAEGLQGKHPGCMVATLTYQERLFDADVRDLNRKAVLTWRERDVALLRKAAEKYPPNDDIDLENVADAFSAITEGGIVLARALGRPEVLPQQVLVYRSYIKMLFQPRGA